MREAMIGVLVVFFGGLIGYTALDGEQPPYRVIEVGEAAPQQRPPAPSSEEQRRQWAEEERRINQAQAQARRREQAAERARARAQRLDQLRKLGLVGLRQTAPYSFEADTEVHCNEYRCLQMSRRASGLAEALCAGQNALVDQSQLGLDPYYDDQLSIYLRTLEISCRVPVTAQERAAARRSSAATAELRQQLKPLLEKAS